MDSQLFSSLAEWTRLESVAFHAAQRTRDASADGALSAKEAEILALRPRTKDEALVQLRFCATFLERNCRKGSEAAEAIRHAVNVLAWSEARCDSPSWPV
jgi:hypothetical protein